jgi:regulatory protein
MRSKLLERGFPETVVELVLTRLKEQKFLDDEEYAQGIVKHEVLVSCRSKKLAELKLRSLNVDEEIIRGALERVGDDEVLQRQTEFVDRAIERLELHRAEDADDELGLPKSFRRLLGQAARKDIPYELVTARWEVLVKGNYYDCSDCSTN